MTGANELTQKSDNELNADDRLKVILQDIIADLGHQWNNHAMVFLKRHSLSRILYFAELYQKIVDVHGVICEFGVHWGSSSALLLNLRGIYEPFNIARKLYAFDTFSGFASVDEKDGIQVSVGDYKSKAAYEDTLEEILAIHEGFSPISHLKRFELIKGDACETVKSWIKEHPEAIIAMAVFDMDLYRPTKEVLESILPRLVKGSLLVFDELNHPGFPGETQAVHEVLHLNNIRLRRHPHQAYCAYAVFGE